MEEKGFWETQGTREGRYTGINNAEGFDNCKIRVPGEVMFLQEDMAIIIMNTGKAHEERADFLNECIRALQGALEELAENTDREKGVLMLQHGVWLDENRRSVWEEEQEISVTRREYDVLHMLFQNKGCVLTYEQIYTRVWKEEYCEGRNSVICLMSRLRRKLKMISCIRSVREIGYMYHAG